MENLKLSFEIIAPLLILMLLGGFLRKIQVFDDSTVKKMNASIFKVLLPTLIFYNLYNSSVADIKDIGTALYATVVIFCAFLLSGVIVSLVEKDNAKRGAMVQGMCRSNFVIFGVPLCVSICGEWIAGKISVAVAIVVPLLNVLSVIVLEFFRGGKPSFKKMLKGIVTNPLIIASILGIIVLISGIKLPVFAEKSVRDVAKIATPLALILLGASVNLRSVKGNLKQLIIAVSGKLIIIPLAGITIATLLGMRGGDIALLIAALASPTAVSSYPMALQMDSDGDLAAQIVAFNTAICIVTVFLWVFILKQINIL